MKLADSVLEQTAPDAPVALVVEDTPEFLALVQKALERRGYKVLVATDVEIACKLIKERASVIQLVVTDYDIGGGKGDAVALCAREEGIGRVYLQSGEPSRADSSLYTAIYHKTELNDLLSQL